jgi:peptide/nickel transport system substrate-binding protein
MRLKLILLAVMLMMSSVLGSVVIAQDTKELTIIYWQAASILTPYLSSGTKDIDASAIILEPLANIGADGEFVPVLATDIPTVANGGVSEDLTSITWTLRDDVLWSDGTPFTADDVIFTWEYCTDPEGGCTYVNNFDDVTSIEAVGDNQVKITFGVPKPYPYLPFVGQTTPVIQKAQFANCVGAEMAACTEQNFAPIGTGPFMIEDFRTNDVVTYVRNPNYRFVDEGKPYFDRVIFKGGGDAESAARAVLETGEADYAWNLQISPDVLASMEAAGNGQIVIAYGQSIERILVNFTDPSPDNPNRSIWMEDGSNAHPFLSNKTIRQAMSMAIDRNTIADNFYGAAGKATCNLISGPPYNSSPNNDICLTWGTDESIAEANAMLDDAGIVDTDGDGIREYNGIPLKVLYQTSTNAVRQDTQALIKQAWSKIGIETELRNIDAGVFFGGDPASPDTFQKFYADVEMFTSGASSPDMEGSLIAYQCGLAPRPDNGWLGQNNPRWCNPEYDALFAEYTATGDLDARAQMVIQLNDLIVQDYSQIPLVFRAAASSAHANSLGGINITGWDSEMWNIEDWYRIE